MNNFLAYDTIYIWYRYFFWKLSMLISIESILYILFLEIFFFNFINTAPINIFVIVVSGPHNLHCHHRPCLRHCCSCCCCRQCRCWSPPLMIRWPPAPIANLCQPLSYPSPSLLLSMLGCCILRPPSSIPTKPPSWQHFHLPTFGLILTYWECVCAFSTCMNLINN